MEMEKTQNRKINFEKMRGLTLYDFKTCKTMIIRTTGTE